MRYRPDIDGLRAVAVLLVFLFHFEVVALGRAGFIGVDIFFVISGFLISSIIWSQLEHGRFTLADFYLRRFRRLAPALICVQLVLIGLSYALLLPQQAKDLAAQNLATQAYVINFYLWRNVSYFGVQSDTVALLHCWSLAIEEQFYLLYPLLLLLVHRLAKRRLARVLTALAVGSFALNVILVHHRPEATFYLLPTRAWELMVGALVPFAVPWFETRARLRTATATAGVLAIALGLASFRPGIAFPGFHALWPTLGTAALIASGAGAGSWVSRVLSRKPFVYVGSISYSMYLVHWPIKVIAQYFLPRYTLPWRWASVGLGLLLAMALYHGVEDPVRKGKLFARPRRFVALYATGVATVAVLATSALLTGGWRGRFSPEVLRLVDAAQDRDEAARACEYHAGAWPSSTGPCRIGRPGAPVTWAIIGDSHAWALDRAFSLVLEQHGQAGVLTFAHACLPVFDVGNRGCVAFNADVGSWIERQPNLRNVVLVSIWRQPIEGLQTADGGFVEGHAALALFQDRFARTLRRLHDAGKQTYVWEPIPTARMDVPSALARNLAFGSHLEIEGSRAEHERIFAFMRQALTDNRALVRGVISPSSVMCASSTCMVEEGGSPLFFDTNHPAFSHAPFYAAIIADQLPVTN